MKDLQAKHKEWCDKNFGGRECQVFGGDLSIVAHAARHLGIVAHCVLKADQGIRGPSKDRNLEVSANQCSVGMDTLKNMGIWKSKETNRPDLHPLLGAVEEVGELIEAHNTNNQSDRIDAVGDIVLYLLDYCNKTGIDFEDAVRTTAEKVHKRDWVKNPVNGEVE